jgi:uncharacterized protein (DUF1697 family)
MTIHIGLLRAVNLPSHGKVAMGDLEALVAELGFEDPQTLLHSGNVVFRGGSGKTTEVEALLQKAVAKRFGFETDFFVRSASEWKSVIAANPFPAEARRDPSHLLVMFLKEAPDRAAVAALQKRIKGREVVRAGKREAYIVYPDGIGRSRLTVAMIESALESRGTGRNWNTVLKLGALAGSI